MHSLYRSSTRRPEDDSVESKHVAPLSHYMINITTVVFDGPSPPFISQTLRDGTPQVQMYNTVFGSVVLRSEMVISLVIYFFALMGTEVLLSC